MNKTKELLGIVVEKDGKNYLLFVYNEEKEVWRVVVFNKKEDLLNQIDADDLMELITNTVQWADVNPVAINCPESSKELEKYDVSGQKTPTQVFKGSLASQFGGVEVKADILELKAFNVFTELTGRLGTKMKPLDTDMVSQIKEAGKKPPVKKKPVTKKALIKKK